MGLEALLNIREGRRHAREKSRLGGTRADLWRHTVGPLGAAAPLLAAALPPRFRKGLGSAYFNCIGGAQIVCRPKRADYYFEHKPCAIFVFDLQFIFQSNNRFTDVDLHFIFHNKNGLKNDDCEPFVTEVAPEIFYGKGLKQIKKWTHGGELGVVAWDIVKALLTCSCETIDEVIYSESVHGFIQPLSEAEEDNGCCCGFGGSATAMIRECQAALFRIKENKVSQAGVPSHVRVAIKCAIPNDDDFVLRVYAETTQKGLISRSKKSQEVYMRLNPRSPSNLEQDERIDLVELVKHEYEKDKSKK